jgi:hypothetical protein
VDTDDDPGDQWDKFDDGDVEDEYGDDTDFNVTDTTDGDGWGGGGGYDDGEFGDDDADNGNEW